MARGRETRDDGRAPGEISPPITTVAAPLPIPTSTAAAATTAYIATTAGATTPPPPPSSEPPEPLRGGRWGNEPRFDLPDPGTLAINTIEERIVDDLAYRVHQSSFLAGPRRRGGQAAAGAGAKSLEDIAAGKVVESLRYDVESGLQTLQKSPQILQEMVLDRMHYVSFRGLQQFVENEASKGEGDKGEEDLIAKEAKMDLEVWIIKNELIMRQDPSSVTGLLTLDDNLDIVFPGSTVTDSYREIRRRLPPKSNFCFFDEKKPAAIRIHNTTEGYIKTFHESTSGVLDGLDWSNVVVAGGIALNTLLRVEGQTVDENQENSWVSADRDSDIDVYIYGLPNPREANKKIKHIYEVWCKNVDAAAIADGKEAPKKLIVKNSKTVNFLSVYPHRRIQIILKIVASPAEVLLNFDLDPCAIGFNGKEVLMLPRCARALETGYSVFTTDLVEGHHLGDRRETQLPRVYKYADRGFGIRILPQYLRTLKYSDFRYYTTTSDRWGREEPVDFVEPVVPTTTLVDTEKHKLMKGLKLTKMLAYLMDDFVHRFWIGRTKRSKHEDEYDSYNEEDEELADEERPFVVDLGHFDGRRQYSGPTSPHGKKGLGGFEIFFWHVALWRKELDGLLTIQRDTFCSPSYEPDGYSELPKYEWDDRFTTEEYATSIRDYNSYLYHIMRDWLTFQHHAPYGRNDTFNDYFTRRTERLCCGDNIDEILERELAIPVFVPKIFEDYANRIVKEVLKEKGLIEPTEEDFELLIPIHKEGTGPGVIPETQRGAYNWTFWIIVPSLSWARIDRRIDEIFEVLWNFFQINVADRYMNLSAEGSRAMWSDLLKQHLDRRAPRVAPEVAKDPDEKKTFVWPDRREVRLFKKWMSDEPQSVDRDMQGYQQEMGHKMYKEEDYRPRIGEEDEEDFWDAKDEEDELGVLLAWRGPLEEVKKGDLEVRGEKRKRVSLAGSLAPPGKREKEEGEGEGEDGGDDE